ncbi:MAG: hypothetical protein WD467_01935 [Candidatus Saccharimonadales bacterium]
MGEQGKTIITAEMSATDALYESIRFELAQAESVVAYIHDTLHPEMDAHRGRIKPCSQGEVYAKLFSTAVDKPGEMWELIEQRRLAKDRDEPGLTADKALEIADIIYYLEQPGGRWLLYGLHEPPEVPDDRQAEIEMLLGVTLELARELCVYKYRTRMLYRDTPDHVRKHAESLVIARVVDAWGY